MIKPNLLGIVRWMLLKTVYSARPDKAAEMLIQSGVKAAGVSLTVDEVRQELDFLADSGLVVLDKAPEEDQDQPWLAKVTAKGVVVIEDSRSACPAGIERPRRS